MALTGDGKAAVLAGLAREFGAEIAVVADEACLPGLREALAGSGIAAAGGAAALVEAAARSRFNCPRPMPSNTEPEASAP